VPAALDEVTMRGLDLDPAKRFGTAREMARALEDALPPVVSSKIGDWVERIARQTLEERSARIAVIESDSSSPPVPAPPVSTPSTSDLTRAEGTAVVTDDMVLTQLSVGSVSAPRPQVPSHLRRRTALAAATAGGLLVVLLLIWIALHRSMSPATTARVADSASAPLPPASNSTSAAADQPVAPSVVVEEAAPSSVASTPQPPPPPVRRAPAYVNPSPNKHTANCNPPWYIDQRGARLFKTECL
jgi:serine/threonine-protein kinase